MYHSHLVRVHGSRIVLHQVRRLLNRRLLQSFQQRDFHVRSVHLHLLLFPSDPHPNQQCQSHLGNFSLNLDVYNQCLYQRLRLSHPFPYMSCHLMHLATLLFLDASFHQDMFEVIGVFHLLELNSFVLDESLGQNQANEFY